MQRDEYVKNSCYPLADSHWSLLDGVHAEDCRLWKVDDGCTKQRSENATVRDGEGAPIHVLYCQGPCASLHNNGRAPDKMHSINFNRLSLGYLITKSYI